ncbi:unnamed protein product [Paramecium pentaurelia]|uniref:Uncharacterized protein n=1 Tax=Paramecium pentaurelia TaxID=43138 RepID=A0A8S1T891_9CILI|nr:unnamed protein product [Paramecium pentaurelia]
MALIHNQNDIQNMFSKAGKITSEKYIVFQRKEEIINNRPRYFKGKSQSAASSEEVNQQVDKKMPEISSKKQQEQITEAEQIQRKNQVKLSQPFSRQLSRQVGHYTKLSKDSKPSCGQYHVKYSELDKAVHSIHDYDKSLKQTVPLEVPGKHGEPENIDKPIVDRPRFSRTCFLDLVRQTQRPDIFFGRPTPHPDRFTYLNVTDSWSKIPRTPSVQLEKQLSRDQMIIYKKKQFAPDYHPNFEFGKKQLGSCGAPFDKLEQRKDIMTKIPPYNHETYFEFDVYSKDPNSKLFRTPTAPNFKQMLDREQDGKSLLPSFMQKYSNTRMGITHLHQKMLEVNNFRDGRFQTVTSSFLPSKGFKKRPQLDESSEEIEQMEEQ